MTAVQKIVLTVLNALVAPLLELTATKWSFALQRTTIEQTLEALRQRSPLLTPAEREISFWREAVINQRKSLRQLRLHLLERTQVWTGATYTPVQQLDGAGLLEAVTLHTAEALELLDVIERITPNLLERTVYAKLNVTMRCALCMQLASFDAIKDLS